MMMLLPMGVVYLQVKTLWCDYFFLMHYLKLIVLYYT